MKYFVLFFLLPSSLLAQTLDPNAKVKAMGLDDDLIQGLCFIATEEPESTGKLHQLFQQFILLDDLQTDIKNLTEEQIIQRSAKLWNIKYCFCYCIQDDWSSVPLDVLAIRSGQEEWVKTLYENPSTKKNLIRTLTNDSPALIGTLADYLYDRFIYTDDLHPFADDYLEQMERRSDLYKYFRNLGAKRMSEMTPEEIERNSQ